MVTIYEIKHVLERLDAESGDKGIEYIDAAIANLQAAAQALDTVGVRGRASVDSLLGCMMGIDMIIGKEGDNG